MTDDIAIDLFKLIKDAGNNKDTGCRRMAKFMAFENFKATTMVVCVDAVIASNGGEPVEIAILMHVLPRCLGDDFFSNKQEFQSTEILELLNLLSSNGIFDVQKSTHLVRFRKGFDPSLLIKESLELVEKTIGKAGHFSKWLSHICEHYAIEKESKSFKRAKKNASRGER